MHPKEKVPERNPNEIRYIVAAPSVVVECREDLMRSLLRCQSKERDHDAEEAGDVKEQCASLYGRESVGQESMEEAADNSNANYYTSAMHTTIGMFLMVENREIFNSDPVRNACDAVRACQPRT